MGPGCFHPRNGGTTTDNTTGYAFNGAGMFPSQKLHFRHFQRAVRDPSMGPGCFHPRNQMLPRVIVTLSEPSMGPGCFHPRNTNRK